MFFRHNQDVLHRGKEGKLVSKRRQVIKEDVYDFTPCFYCDALILKSNLLKHCKTCKACIEVKKQPRNLVQKAEVRMKVKAGLIGEELGSVLEGLKNDAVGQTVLQDNLLLHYGQSLVDQQLDSELYRYKDYLKQKMRESGDFLLKLREKSGHSTAPMEFFFHPKHWDLMVDVAKSFDSDGKKLKIGHLIGKICAVMCGIAMRQEDDNTYRSVQKVRQLYKDEWSIKVSSR